MQWPWRRTRTERIIEQSDDHPEQRRHGRHWRRLLIILALIGIAVSIFLLLRPSDPRFVIVITPFADHDNRTGSQIAGALARQLRAQGGNLVQVITSATRPTNSAEALALAQQNNADVLVWGTVEPGGMIDSPSLRPELIYLPHNIDVSQAWQSFAIRFALPNRFSLSTAPISGQAALAPYLLALATYHHGEADLAIDQLHRLLDLHPQLSPLLPQLLRGNLLWARGWYTAAATEYQTALTLADGERALVANNLGAILFDTRHPDAPRYFAEAIDLLDGRDLGQLRVNLALWALREQRARDAVSDLEQARNLLPAHPDLELLIATAYRESGQLDDAAMALNQLAPAKTVLLARTPIAIRAPVETRLNATLTEERALIHLERLLPLAGPLYWALETADPLPPAAELRSVRDQLRTATELSNRSVSLWRQRAASEAAIFPGTGLMATGQAEQSEATARRQRFALALIDAALQAVEGRNAPNPASQLIGALFGAASPANPTIETLSQLRDQQPDNVAILLALGFALRIDKQFDQAAQTYQQVIDLAPQLPDGYAGIGKVALARNDRAGALALFRAALERNNRFFPAHLALARLAEGDGDWPAAIDHWRALVAWQESPYTIINLSRTLRRSGASGFAEAERLLVPLATTNAEAAIELARLYNDAGLPAEAAAVYRDALILEPRSTVAAFELGETYIRLGDLNSAERMLRNAIEFDDRNLDARLKLAELYEGPLNQPNRAIEQYRIALTQGINDLNRLIAIGQAALASNTATVAIQALERALTLQPDSVTARQLIARAYFAGNRLDAATQAARRTLEQTANRADPEAIAARANAWLTLADVARRRNDPAAAEEAYRQTLAIDPQSIAAHIGLGELAGGQGNWGVALAYFETAANLPGGDTNATAQFWLGEALLRNGQLARALAAYQRALALQPQYPEALLGMAQTQYALGHADEALQTVEQAIRQQSNYAEAHLFRGKLLQEAGRFSEARAAYDASISANDRIAESFYRRALLAIRANDYDQAVRDLNRAVALQPNFPEAHYWLGRAYYAQGRNASALQAIQQAITLNPDYSEAMFYSGLIAEDQANFTAARAAYQTLIAREPTSEWGQRARAQLERLP
ncbi:tetratricopeptide repeat protein [uncultured Chloroflexus sp.]|uniref:tetratricopeptide repeat protein n=1 Tax=uncultured Chloroflexus sp. TaxID=214040 RepID=UPI00262DA964|nr:tetratricopeptide repeat protein [uncultured Chloroflexus sp.]